MVVERFCIFAQFEISNNNNNNIDLFEQYCHKFHEKKQYTLSILSSTHGHLYGVFPWQRQWVPLRTGAPTEYPGIRGNTMNISLGVSVLDVQHMHYMSNTFSALNSIQTYTPTSPECRYKFSCAPMKKKRQRHRTKFCSTTGREPKH